MQVMPFPIEPPAEWDGFLGLEHLYIGYLQPISYFWLDGDAQEASV